MFCFQTLGAFGVPRFILLEDNYDITGNTNSCLINKYERSRFTFVRLHSYFLVGTILDDAFPLV